MTWYVSSVCPDIVVKTYSTCVYLPSGSILSTCLKLIYSVMGCMHADQEVDVYVWP